MKSLELLIVEDNPVSLKMVLSALSRTSPEVNIQTAESVEEAYAILRSVDRAGVPPFDLILCDVYFENGPDGIGLWQDCQKKYPWIDFILISASSVDALSKKYPAIVEWPPFIEKPLSASKMRQMFQQRYVPGGMVG